MKIFIFIISSFLYTTFSYAQNDTDFWVVDEKLNQQFLKRSQEIQFIKHHLDSLNGAYLNALMQVLKSDFPNKESYNDGHRKFMLLLFENESDSSLFNILNNIDLNHEYLAKMPSRNPITYLIRDQKLGFNATAYPIFMKIYENNLSFQQKIISYFVFKFPVDEIKGELKMKMWLKIFEENKPYFNECYNNYFKHSTDKEKYKKISEIRKIVNGE